MIEITKGEHENLMRKSLFLDNLEYAGVDSWTGYEYAHEGFVEDTGMDYWDFNLEKYNEQEENNK